MKKILFPLFTACAFLQACAAQNPDSYTLKGEIKNFPGKMLYLSYGSQAEGTGHLDSAAVKDGKFVFKGMVEQPWRALLTDVVNPKPTSKRMGFYIEPGNLHLTVDWNHMELYKITGSRTNDEAKMIEEQMMNVMNAVKALRAQMASASFEEQKVLGDSIQRMGMRVQQSQMDFMATHPASCISAVLLQSMMSRMETEELKCRFALLDEKVQKSNEGKVVAKEIALREKLQPGHSAPELAATDINGKAFRLSDLRGKYVILDFWASWCAPCRASNPHLIELWNKYHDKGLEIVCVADDDGNQKAWHGAIEKDGIGMFRHLLRGLKRTERGDYDSSNDLSALYNVHVLPTKYLINADGNIIGKMSTEEITAKLAEIFAVKK